MKTLRIHIIFYCLLVAVDGLAQTCCSAGAPITSSFDIARSDNQNFALQLDYEYKSVNRLVDNNQILINDPRQRNGQNVLLKTDYILNDKWSFSAFIPFVIQTRSTFSETQKASGIGDLTLISQYTFPISDQQQIKAALGVKLPTGNRFIVDDLGITLSPDMQSGSGTVDFIGRLAFVQSHFIAPNLNFQSAVSYRYNTTNPHFGDPNKIQGRSFKFGNELLFTTSFNYLILIGTWFTSPEIGLQWRQVSPNKEQELDAPNSGGWWLNIPLAWHFQINKNMSFNIYGNIPVQQNLSGLQISTSFSTGIRLRYAFNKKSKLF